MVENSPSTSDSALDSYDAGSSVNYDKVVSADGHQWIYYISYSGARRYIAID